MKLFDLEGKVAVITGASGGIGQTVARLFSEAGAAVLLTDIKKPEGEIATAGSGVQFVCQDVTDSNAWNTVIAKAEAEFGAVSILVNNAGVASAPTSLEDLGDEEYRRIVEANQFSCFYGMRAVTPSMIRAGGGSIINISSVAGLKAQPGAIAYVASKFAVTGMTKTAALDLAKYNIRVNSVHPGLVDTPMVRPEGSDKAFEGVLEFASSLPIPRPGQPGEIASLIAYLASDASSFCTGGVFPVDGGWTL